MKPRELIAFNYFVSVGWTPPQAAGLVANLQAESGLRPDAVGDGGLAYGIAQWHPDRQEHFELAMGENIRGSSLENQLAFAHAELNRWEKAAGSALRSCVTAGEAGACVSKMYERPADREGEAAKRAAMAERLLGGTQPAAPIEDRSEEVPVQPQEETTMPFLAALLPMVLQLFAPRAQVALGKITGNETGATQLVTELLNQGGKLLNIPTDAVPTNDQAVQVVAALQKAKTGNAALVQQLEDHALDYLDRLAPTFDKIQKIEAAQWQADNESQQSAFERNRQDPTQNLQRPMQKMTFWLVAVGAGTVAGLIGFQMWINGGEEPNGQLIALFIMLITTFVNMLRSQNDWSFGSSHGSEAKNAIIARLPKPKE